jgi:DNA replication protein DnaC
MRTPAWHQQRHLRDLRDDGPYGHCAEPIRLARTWVGRLASESAPRRGLYFYGPKGSGKTSIAAAIAEETGATYWYVRELVARAKEEMNCHVRESVWDKVVRAQVLVLDDVGKQRATPYVVEQMHDVIERRYDRGGLTVVTSNLDPVALGAFFDGPAFSRFSSMTAAVPVVGPDLRMVAA